MKTCSGTNHVYTCEKNVDHYEITLVHKFPSISNYVESLAYYITVNGDRTFIEGGVADEVVPGTKTNIYKPEFIGTKYTGRSYVSTYLIDALPFEKLVGRDEKLVGRGLSVKLHLLLPYDHKNNIEDLKLYSCSQISS